MTKWFNINKVFKIGLLALILTVVVVSLGYADECPSAEDLRVRYGAGCWSCLVFEKLTSAFLYAAKKGLPITAKAGATLLWLGCAIWFVFWALKNVSSFTQVQIGNILNDLIKFLFKVAIAYWFIVYGTAAINKYIVTPLLSVGAIIGQQFWDEDVKDYMEDWETITEEDYREAEKAVEQIVSQTPIPASAEGGMVSPSESDLTPEEIAENEAINEANNANFKKSAIPNLLIPGVRGGYISSGAGCRPKSATGGKGSTCHKGVDVGGLSKDGCVPYISAGPGTLYYIELGGYGRVAMINHGKVGDYYWVTSYNHMSSGTADLKQRSGLFSGMSIMQGVPIGCTGGSGGKRVGNVVQITDNGYSKHVHFEVYAAKENPGGGWPSSKQVDPLALLGGEIVFLRDICPNCTGSNRLVSKAAENFLGCQTETDNWTCRKQVGQGWPAGGEAIQSLNSSVDFGSISDTTSIITIPEIKYTGPTEIMPKSVMNSMLGAMRAITNTVAENMVLGNAIMCYAGLKNGGAWYISAFDIEIASITNFFTWLQGAIIWVLGFMLLMSVGYYFIDISFKIGFAVLALPLVMGLWPFGITQDKLFVVISIIAKASACFAFMAVSTAFGMELVSQSLGGLEELYSNMETLDIGGRHDGKYATIRNAIEEKLEMFSISFLMILFSIMYFYKLVQSTCSDLVNKFFPDKAFGDSNPMHSGATMATSFVARPLKNAASLVGDIATHQVGKAAQGALRATGHAIAHPMRAGRAIGGKGKQALKATGKGLKATGKGLKAAGHAIANPKETAKKAANATKEGIKSGAKSLGKGIVSGAKAVGGAIIHPLKTIGNAIMGKKRW